MAHFIPTLRILSVIPLLVVLVQCGSTGASMSPTDSPLTSSPVVDASLSPTGNSLASSSTETPAPSISLIGPEQQLVVAGANGYNYQQIATADFDGDSVQEQAFLIANTDVVNGQPMWDDGHTWQVYIEEPTGERTYLFARFVQLGIVEAKVTEVKPDGKPHILLLERWPSTLNIYDISYNGPSSFDIHVIAEHHLAPYPGGFVLKE